MHTKPLTFLAVFLLMHPSLAAQPVPEAPNLSDSQIDELNAGEILVEVINGEIPVGDAIGVIDASLEQVRAILFDLDRFAEYMPDVVESEILGRDGDAYLFRAVIDTPWPMSQREFTVRIWVSEGDEEGDLQHYGTWDYVPDSGNLVDIDGFILLLPWGDDGSRTLLRYHLSVDLGTWVPDFLVSWATENMLPGMVNNIRGQVDQP